MEGHAGLKGKCPYIAQQRSNMPLYYGLCYLWRVVPAFEQSPRILGDFVTGNCFRFTCLGMHLGCPCAPTRSPYCNRGHVLGTELCTYSVLHKHATVQFTCMGTYLHKICTYSVPLEVNHLEEPPRRYKRHLPVCSPIGDGQGHQQWQAKIRPLPLRATRQRSDWPF